jgi:predicted MPP superfamily phosphohydrolase
MRPALAVPTALGATAVAAVGYASVVERNLFRLRRYRVPVLPEGARPLRLLHISDAHLTPGRQKLRRWISSLAALQPDFVINTGDNLAAHDAVPAMVDALGPLLDLPGAFVMGSNDYFAPRPKNPARYLLPDSGRRIHGIPLPWEKLRDAMTSAGWIDCVHATGVLHVGDRRLRVAGVDDPHLKRDRYDRIAGAVPNDVELGIGLTHSPEPRVLDEFVSDGYRLLLAGHTHGGQLRVPVYGALVTNCGIDAARARGLHRWGLGLEPAWLHVSAGLGTSPYAPVRFACPPEASLLTLVPATRSSPGRATG